MGSRVLPETEGGVGEVWGAVKVSDSQAAADVVHGGQTGVPPLHDAPLDGTLIGSVAESHQPVVVIQTERGNNLETFYIFLTLKHTDFFLFLLKYILHILC